MHHFNRAVQFVSQVLIWLAAVTLAAMMLLQAINVFIRGVHQPILGAEEIIGYGLVVVVCCGLAYTSVIRSHVRVEVLFYRFPERTQIVLNTISTLLAVGVFAVIAWQSAVHAWEQWLLGEISIVLGFPILPLRVVVVVGFAALCLALLADLFKLFAKVFRK